MKADASKLEPRLMSHLREYFASSTRTMSDEEVVGLIRMGVDRAREHGIDTERGACKYLNLMFAFGEDFDRDPRLPWAREILSGARIHHGFSTIDFLHRVALEHEDQARGLQAGGS